MIKMMRLKTATCLILEGKYDNPPQKPQGFKESDYKDMIWWQHKSETADPKLFGKYVSASEPKSLKVDWWTKGDGGYIIVYYTVKMDNGAEIKAIENTVSAVGMTKILKAESDKSALKQAWKSLGVGRVHDTLHERYEMEKAALAAINNNPYNGLNSSDKKILQGMDLESFYHAASMRDYEGLSEEELKLFKQLKKNKAFKIKTGKRIMNWFEDGKSGTRQYKLIINDRNQYYYWVIQTSNAGFEEAIYSKYPIGNKAENSKVNKF